MLHFAMVEILPAAVFLVPLYLLLNKVYFHSLPKAALSFLFAFYLCAVYALVGLPNITYIRFDPSGNLIPFRDMLNGLRSTVQNVLLFVPLGIFLPLFGDRFQRMRHTVLFGFGMSLVIEAAQIFTYRATDVNDLITNTVGTLLGFFLGNILWRIIPLKPAQPCGDLAIPFGTAACVMFFLQPFVVALL